MRFWLIFVSSLFSHVLLAAENIGFYRFPSLHDNTVLFTAEGDLWTVPLSGGQAFRLTSDHGFESHGKISPDGKKVAFLADYDGPREIYVMPFNGGMPKRLTFTNSTVINLVGWTQDGRILYSSNHDSSHTLNTRLFIINPDTRKETKVPLNQAFDGAYSKNGDLYFTRLIGSSDNTRNYSGGTAKNIWLYQPGSEAMPLTSDYLGTSTEPSIWNNRVYFASDRSGAMNIWSMNLAGGDLMQHSFFEHNEVNSPSLHNGHMVFQVAGDLFHLDLDSDIIRKIDITLRSDLDQKRAYWLDAPIEYLDDVSLSPNNKKLLLTSRGQIVIKPIGDGRTVNLPAPEPGIFFSQAQFVTVSGKILAVARQDAQQSIWLLSANGANDAIKLFDLEKSLSSGPFQSSDGQKLVWVDTDQVVWLHDCETNRTVIIDKGLQRQTIEVSWSPNDRWLAYTRRADNLNKQIVLYNVNSGESYPVTSDRYNSKNPAWDEEGEWLYFVSSRFYASSVSYPLGYAQPEPYSERNDGIFAIAVNSEARWPFQERDELTSRGAKSGSSRKFKKASRYVDPIRVGDIFSAFGPDAFQYVMDGLLPDVPFDMENINSRLYQVPMRPAARIENLEVVGRHLYWVEIVDETALLKVLPMSDHGSHPFVVSIDIDGYAPSLDKQSIYFLKGSRVYLVRVGEGKAAALKIPLENWRIRVDPVAEWRQIFFDSWMAYRDHFADASMNGVDWESVLHNHLPLLDRVTDRSELDDIIGSMLGQLGVLHTQIYSGDERDNGNLAFEGSLGAKFTKVKGGFRIDKIFRPDPEKPHWQSPLARPGITIQEGDLLTRVNHQPITSSVTPEEMLTYQANHQTLLELKRKDSGKTYQAVVEPMTPHRSHKLRYRSWVNNNRLKVDELAQRHIGYVHLSGLGGKNFTEWVQQFYPVHDRDGLILDLRYNSGGNISSWILSRLMRKAYSYCSSRGTSGGWNMPYAFRGHIVLLVNEHTSSDAEELIDGFRKLGLGTIIGTRTWGGRIGKFNYVLLDNGEVSLPFISHVLPDNTWPPENLGVEPDIYVDNFPYASFKGEDAQLVKAVEVLQEKIDQEPISKPVLPEGPLAQPAFLKNAISSDRSEMAYPRILR